MITTGEREVLDALASAHSRYVQLTAEHPDELRDWVTTLHRLQDLIAVRVARRAEPGVFPTRRYL